MATINNEIERKLWASADALNAGAGLKSSEYSVPILGLIFLRFADFKFSIAEKELTDTAKAQGSRKTISKTDYQARGIMYLPEKARYSYLLNLPDGENIGKTVNEAMKAIETENEELKDVLPKTYMRLGNSVLTALLKTFSEIPMDVEGDMFGNIYEYFLGKFAMSEGQKGGEFFTPTSLVKLIVEVIEPYNGRILDPACGSGGMFVQSAQFVQNHKKSPSEQISIYGQEKTAETVRLCKMNLAVHGLGMHVLPVYQTAKAESDQLIDDEYVISNIKEKIQTRLEPIPNWSARWLTGVEQIYEYEDRKEMYPAVIYMGNIKQISDNSKTDFRLRLDPTLKVRQSRRKVPVGLQNTYYKYHRLVSVKPEVQV